MVAPAGPVYLDSSALAKLFLNEPESLGLEAAVIGRRDLLLADLGITEVVSAFCRRARSGVFAADSAAAAHQQLLRYVRLGYFRVVPLTVGVYRDAEQLLLGGAGAISGLRGMDALHLALAVAAGAATMAVYDRRLAAAAASAGLAIYPEQG